MKKLIALVSSVALITLLTACAAGSSWNASLGNPSSSDTDTKLIVEKEVQPMSRNEIIVAVKECETSGLRAVVVYAKRRINGIKSDVVADVSCAPKFTNHF